MELQSLRSRGPSGFAALQFDENGAIQVDGSDEVESLGVPNDLHQAASPRSEVPGNRDQLRLKAAVGMLGNILEWADFAVFGFFSAEIGNAFFPSNNPTAEVTKTFAVFAAAFVMRPLGGVLFGHIGDKLGRKPALLLSIALMAGATFFVGCLPTYEAAGVFAPLTLLLLRCLQGLSVGGQLVGSFLFTVEAAPKDERGFYGSLTLASAIGGTLVGSLEAGILKSVLSPEALNSCGWRLPFWLGISVGPLGYLVKDRIEEDAPSQLQQQQQQQHEGGSGIKGAEHALSTNEASGGSSSSPGWSLLQQPSVQALLRHPLVILATMAGTTILTANTYVCLVWLPTYEQTLRVDPGANVEEEEGNRSFGYILSTAALFCLTGMYPLVGWLSDRVGRGLVMSVGAALLMFSGPLLLLVLPGTNRAAIWAAMALFVIATAAYGAPFPAWMVEAFPRKIRYSAVGLGYNIAQALFGGTAPLAATSLAALDPQTLSWVAAYLFVLSGASAAVVWIHTSGWNVCGYARSTTSVLVSRRGYQRAQDVIGLSQAEAGSPRPPGGGGSSNGSPMQLMPA